MKRVITFAIFAAILLTSCKKKEQTPEVQVESISFAEAKYTLEEGQSIKLGKELTILPEAVGDTVSLEWESVNSDIASVNSNGRVTALYEGTTTIRVTALGKSAECKIVVTPLKMTAFRIPESLGTVYANVATPIEVTDLEPTGISSRHLTWTSSEEGVLPTFNNEMQRWEIKTDFVGDVTLTAEADGLEPQTCKFTTVVNYIKSIKVTPATSLVMAVGSKLQLGIEVEKRFKDAPLSYDEVTVSTGLNYSGNSVTSDGLITAGNNPSDFNSINVAHAAVNKYDNKCAVQISIRVIESEPVTSFTMTPSEMELSLGSTDTIWISDVQPAEASPTSITYTVTPSDAVITTPGFTDDGRRFFALTPLNNTSSCTFTALGAPGVTRQTNITIKKVAVQGIMTDYSKYLTVAGLNAIITGYVYPSNASVKQLKGSLRYSDDSLVPDNVAHLISVYDSDTQKTTFIVSTKASFTKTESYNSTNPDFYLVLKADDYTSKIPVFLIESDFIKEHHSEIPEVYGCFVNDGIDLKPRISINMSSIYSNALSASYDAIVNKGSTPSFAASANGKNIYYTYLSEVTDDCVSTCKWHVAITTTDGYVAKYPQQTIVHNSFLGYEGACTSGTTQETTSPTIYITSNTTGSVHTWLDIKYNYDNGATRATIIDKTLNYTSTQQKYTVWKGQSCVGSHAFTIYYKYQR